MTGISDERLNSRTSGRKSEIDPSIAFPTVRRGSTPIGAQAQAAEATESALRDQAAAEQARQVITKAEVEMDEFRASVAKQLNLILETRDTARGLIVNISSVFLPSCCESSSRHCPAIG
jgi:heterodisulfide reductase subunit A-like polyferredoxin